jgi:hypothetical protein
MHGEILSLCLLQTVLLAVANSQPAVLSDFAAARQRMVEEQLSAPGRDIKNRLEPLDQRLVCARCETERRENPASSDLC